MTGSIFTRASLAAGLLTAAMISVGCQQKANRFHGDHLRHAILPPGRRAESNGRGICAACRCHAWPGAEHDRPAAGNATRSFHPCRSR